MSKEAQCDVRGKKCFTLFWEKLQRQQAQVLYKLIKKICYVQSGTYIKKSLKSIKMKLWAFISSIKFLLPGKCKELGYF